MAVGTYVWWLRIVKISCVFNAVFGTATVAYVILDIGANPLWTLVALGWLASAVVQWNQAKFTADAEGIHVHKTTVEWANIRRAHTEGHIELHEPVLVTQFRTPKPNHGFKVADGNWAEAPFGQALREYRPDLARDHAAVG